MTVAQIKIDGLRELQANLKRLDGESQKQLRIALNDAAQIVVNVTRPRVPLGTGNARASIGVASSQREARVKVGGKRAPYYPWLDFGGRTGRAGATKRRFIKGGRYLFPAYESQRENFLRLLQKRITAVATGAGFTTDGAE